MYRWLRRQLPSTRLARRAVVVALLGATVGLLVLGVFPYVDAHLPLDRVTVGP